LFAADNIEKIGESIAGSDQVRGTPSKAPTTKRKENSRDVVFFFWWWFQDIVLTKTFSESN
jgi:hypothetical protein